MPPHRCNIAIKELPNEERPRERLLHYGPQALSTAELLAIVLRTGTQELSAIGLAEFLLAKCQGLRGVAKATVAELSQIKGIGPVKAVQIAACVELGRRLAARTVEQHPLIHSPEDVARLLMPELRDETKEHFKSVLLDVKNRVLRVLTVSVGTLDSSLVHPREVFKEAITASAAGVIVAHNHPSGDPTPSAEDRAITKRLVEAGRILGVELLDHLVIGDGRWISMKQNGLLE
jgi:DNA repair protein RadC